MGTVFPKSYGTYFHTYLFLKLIFRNKITQTIRQVNKKNEKYTDFTKTKTNLRIFKLIIKKWLRFGIISIILSS